MSDGWFAVALCVHPLNPQGRSQHANGAWDSRTISNHCGHHLRHRGRTKNLHYYVTMNRRHRCVIQNATEANNSARCAKAVNSFGRCATEASSYDRCATMEAGYTAAHCGLQACAVEAANNASHCHDCRYRGYCCRTGAASRWAGAVPAEACCRPGSHGHCHGSMNRSSASHDQSSMGTSASRRSPACVGHHCLYQIAARCRYAVHVPDRLIWAMASGQKLHLRRCSTVLKADQTCSTHHGRHGRYDGYPAQRCRERWSLRTRRLLLRQSWEPGRCRSSHSRRRCRKSWILLTRPLPVRRSWGLRHRRPSNSRWRCRRYHGDPPGLGRHARQSLRCPDFLKRRRLRLPVPPRAALAVPGYERTLVQPGADVW
jgi:hypothetical protein